MSEGKGGDDLRVFDDLVKGAGWVLPTDATDRENGPSADDALARARFEPPPPIATPHEAVSRVTQTGWPTSAAMPAQSISMRPVPPAPIRGTSGGPPHAPPSMPPPPPARQSDRTGRPAARSALPPPKSLSSSSAEAAQVPEGEIDFDSPSNGSQTASADNPFLAPIQALEDGGPESLLPPPPTDAEPPSLEPPTMKRSSLPANLAVPPSPAKVRASGSPSGRILTPPPHLKPPATVPPDPPAPLRRSTPPPPAITRSRSSRPLPPPPRVSPSMTPPPALAGTVPPRQRRSLDSDISELQGRARRRKWALYTVIGALAVGGYYARDRLSVVTSIAMKGETASLRATAKHDGIKLVLDGKEMGTLPKTIEGLAPGEHSLVFEGGDRYASQRSPITLSPNEIRTLDSVSLKVTKGAATFDVKTPGTSLVLISNDERRALTDYSHPIDIDNSKGWMLEATKPGFKSLIMPVTFEDQAEKTFVVALTEPSRGESAPATAEAPPAGKPDKGAYLAPKNEAKAPAPAPAAAAPKAAGGGGGGTCTLNINSLPMSKITLDGRPIGMTPKLGVSAPPGTHSVMLISDSGRKATSVTCKAGETKMVAVRLAEPE